MKKTWKKSLAMLIAAAMTATMLAGCQSGGEVANEVTEEAILSVDENAEVTISVGGWPSKEGADLDRWNERKESFEKLYPNITIEPDTWQFDLKTFYPKAQAGLLPTVFFIHFTESEKLINGGYVADLTPVMKKAGILDQMNSQVRGILSKDDKLYAIPTNAYVMGMGYNVDLFKKAGLMNEDETPKAPKDWNEVREYAKLIKEKTGVAGFTIPSTNNCGGWMFSNIAWSYGVDFMEQQEDGSWKATFDTPECVAALQLIKDMRWVDKSMPENGLISLEEYYKLFGTGQAAMQIASADGAVNAVYNYEMPKENAGCMEMPAGPERKVGLLGGAIHAVAGNATPEQIVAAFKWMEFCGYTPDMSEESKASTEQSYQTDAEKGKAIGAYKFNIWGEESEKTKFIVETINKYANVNINHFKSYNDSIINNTVEIQPEEPMECQALYSVLDSCIQKVLTDENADCAALIKQANEEFQTNILDNVEIQ